MLTARSEAREAVLCEGIQSTWSSASKDSEERERERRRTTVTGWQLQDMFNVGIGVGIDTKCYLFGGLY